MNFAKYLFRPQAAALRPRLACEITPAGVVAARPGPDHGEVLSAFAPLRPGVFSPSLKTANFSDRAEIARALGQALDQIGPRDTKVTVVVPDAAVRVLLLDFDSLPAKQAEALPIIRFRLRKLVPFDVEDAAVSYQAMSSRDGMVRILAAVSPAFVIGEYESAVREAGYEPGVLLPSTLAALAAVNPDEPSLVINRNANTVTTAITRENELLLHRTLEVTGLELAGLASTERTWLPGEDARYAAEEFQQSVGVAIAYFEDTLSAPPRQLLSCGLGGSEALIHLLGDTAIPARDLVPTPALGGATSIPRGLLAGVVGALAS